MWIVESAMEKVRFPYGIPIINAIKQETVAVVMALEKLSPTNSKETRMKHSLLLLLATCLLVGCKPNQTKKALDIVRKEYKALNENQGIKYLKYKHRMETAKELIGSSSSYSLCYSCNGYGVLYLVNEYGNPILDYNGNFTFTTCQDCGGNGYVKE